MAHGREFSKNRSPMFPLSSNVYALEWAANMFIEQAHYFKAFTHLASKRRNNRAVTTCGGVNNLFTSQSPERELIKLAVKVSLQCPDLELKRQIFVF